MRVEWTPEIDLGLNMRSGKVVENKKTVEEKAARTVGSGRQAKE
jgi:hypothetical protein